MGVVSMTHCIQKRRSVLEIPDTFSVLIVLASMQKKRLPNRGIFRIGAN